MLLFFSVCLFGQSKEIDNLKKQLGTLQDSARVDCMNELSDDYTFAATKDSAEHYANLAYEEAKKLGYIYGIAVAASRKSRIALHFDDDYVKSETFARDALTWFEKTENKKDIETVYDELQSAFISQSKYDEAYKYAVKKYNRSKTIGNQYGVYDALSGFADIHFFQGNYDSAYYFYQQAQQIAFAEKNEAWESGILFNFGALYRAIEDYTTALSYYRQAFQRDNPSNIKFRIDNDWDIWVRMEFAELFSLQQQYDSAWHYYSLSDTTKASEKNLRAYLVSTGEFYLLQKNYTKALQNFLRGLAIHRKLNDAIAINRTLLDIAKTYFAINNNALTLAYAKESIDLALKTKSKPFIRDGYEILYSVYDRLHKTDSAYFYYQKYIVIKELVVSDQTKGKFAAYRFEQKIELLNKEKELQQEQIKQTSLQRTFLIIGIIAIIVIAVIVLRNTILIRKNEAQLRKIAENELEKKKLESKIIEAKFNAQKTKLEMQALRAQMNPHFIFNSLNSINRFILQNNRAQASEFLTKFSKLVRMILQNSQSSLITLESELESLALYLEMEALRFDHHFVYKISVSPELDISALKVPPLIIQPFAENAIWHGLMHKEDQGHLDIDIWEQNDNLFCKITDDGIGRMKSFALSSKSATKHKSMGLKITSDRIAMLQSENINDLPVTINDLVNADGSPAGTEIIIKIPVIYDETNIQE